jgi:diguanylate cyclase (GGDEF)-like protein
LTHASADTSRHAGTSIELALIFIDLDGFKAVNDAYDHETGDMLIRAVSAGLSSVVAGQGILARLGGDEFAILLSGNDAVSRAETISRNILTLVKDPFDLDGRLAGIGASIGIAELGDQPLDPAELMRRADIAMYDAKDGGRNRWRRFDGELASSAVKIELSPTRSGPSLSAVFLKWLTSLWSTRAPT